MRFTPPTGRFQYNPHFTFELFDTYAAPGGRLSFRGFCGTYEVEATSNGRTVKRQFHVGLKPDGERRATLEKVNKGGCHVGLSEIAVF